MYPGNKWFQAPQVILRTLRTKDQRTAKPTGWEQGRLGQSPSPQDEVLPESLNKYSRNH